MSRLVFLGLVLTLAACRESAPSAERADTAAGVAPRAAIDGSRPDSTVASATAPVAAPPLTADGWGALRIGMTRADVVAAMGEDADPAAVGGPDPAACDEFRPARAPQGLLVMIEDGRLTRISLGAGSRVRTDQGLAVGDSATAVRAAYGQQVTATSHKYEPAPAEYLAVWASGAGTPQARGIVYEVGTAGRVQRVRAGGPSVQYVEGCL